MHERSGVEVFEILGAQSLDRSVLPFTCQGCYHDSYLERRNASDHKLRVITAAVESEAAAERVKQFFHSGFVGDPPIPVEILEPSVEEPRWRVRLGYCFHCRLCLVWLTEQVQRVGGVTRAMGDQVKYQFHAPGELRQILQGACEIGNGLLQGRW